MNKPVENPIIVQDRVVQQRKDGYVEIKKRTLNRVKHCLPPRQWSVVVRVTDTPEPGETYLTEDEIKKELSMGFDLPAGLDLEVQVVRSPEKE